MGQDKAMIEQAALDWAMRLDDPAFEDWEAFETWLNADPAHADAYHEAAIAAEDMAALLRSAPAAAGPAHAAPRRGIARRAWLGGAIAASIAAIVGYGMIDRASAPYSIETQPGVRRLVALEDGTSVTLNGGTKLSFDRNDTRYAKLEHGEALFTVLHDEDRPFRVLVGGATLIDVGTRFTVVREANATRVAVSEGAVVYNPDAEAVRIDAGRALRVVDGQPTMALRPVSPEAVAAWKDGRLVYDGQPMREVAGDLARYYGIDLVVDPAIAERPYHGVLSLDPDGNIARMGALLDAQVTRRDKQWVLGARQ